MADVGSLGDGRIPEDFQRGIILLIYNGKGNASECEDHREKI